jgi:hypothetical protein
MLLLFVTVIYLILIDEILMGRRGGDHMVVGFTTTCAISAYHH